LGRFKKPVNTIELRDMRPGDRARIVAVSGTQDRLHELGMVPGTEIEFVRIAPFGDPVEILVRGTRLCLRRSDMAGIQVERIP
jgi:Fe2+ transport system protein FeoA